MARRNSPTQQSLQWFRARNIPARITERWVKTKTGGFRLDLWGCDIQCLFAQEVLNVQAGMGSNHAAKIDKASKHPDVRLWLASPARTCWIMTWSKRVTYRKDGTKAKLPRWTPRVTQLQLIDGEIVASDFTLKP